MINKLAFIAVIVLFPALVYGATVAELQAQIDALLAQVQDLQSQLSAVQSGAAAPCSFTRSLTVGSVGEDVQCLQKYLNSSGYLVAASGAGSLGNETEYFGSLTKLALVKWQAANGVSPASGYFGSLTRAKLSSLNAVPSPAPAPMSTPEPAPAAVLEAVAVPTTTPAVTLPNPFDSTLKIEQILSPTTLSSYGIKNLAEFRLSASERNAITRIRLKNSGTFSDVYLVGFKLINSATNAVLATADGPVSKYIEFKMAEDSAKTDKGLAASGNTYYVSAIVLTPTYGKEKPYIRLDIESSSDVSAFDYNDLIRVADISKTNTFPIEGPKIYAF